MASRIRCSPIRCDAQSGTGSSGGISILLGWALQTSTRLPISAARLKSLSPQSGGGLTLTGIRSKRLNAVGPAVRRVDGTQVDCGTADGHFEVPQLSLMCRSTWCMFDFDTTGTFRSRVGLCLDHWQPPGALLRTLVALALQIDPRDAWFGQDDRIWSCRPVRARRLLSHGSAMTSTVSTTPPLTGVAIFSDQCFSLESGAARRLRRQRMRAGPRRSAPLSFTGLSCPGHGVRLQPVERHHCRELASTCSLSTDPPTSNDFLPLDLPRRSVSVAPKKEQL